MENEDLNIRKIKLITDDFKSSNFNIRMFKVQHLGTLMELMTKEQIIDDIIPLMSEFIFNYETNDEVLCEYSKQLKNIFLMFLKEEKIIKEPLRILMCLSNHDDEQIRNTAFSHLKEILKYYHDEKFIEIELIPLLNDNNVKKKYSQLQLIPLFYQYVGEKLKELLSISYISLCSDDSMHIRRLAAANIKNFHLVNDQSKKMIALAEENLRMLSDPSEIVKVNAIESTIDLMQILPQKNQKSLVVNSLNELLVQEKSWRIKYAMTNFICSVCKYFDKPFNENNFLPFLLQALDKKNEFEVRLNVLTNISAIFSYITEKVFMEKIVKLFKSEFVNDPHWNIRAANAVILLKLINRISNKDEESLLFSYVYKIMKEDLFEVKYYLICKIDELFNYGNINKFEELISNVYFPIITEGLQCTNWRLRYEIIKSFNNLINQYPNWINQKEEIFKFIAIFFTDNASEIRQYSVKIIEFLIKAQPNIIFDILNMQQATLASSNYSIRIFSIKSIVSLINYYPIELLEKTIIPLLINKFNDTIANVRLYAFEAIVFLLNRITKNATQIFLIDHIKLCIRNAKITQYTDITSKLKQINIL